jgi:hypothetical protein
MPQLHFSVDGETARRLAREARRRGASVSKLVAELVSRGLPSEWPAGYLKRVVGSCARDPLRLPADLPTGDVDLGTR